MFDPHQAEITVMQFTGHSLPVHQSMSVRQDFNPVPYCQLSPPTRFLPIDAIRMSHLLPVHHFGIACLAGSKVNIQQIVKKVKWMTLVEGDPKTPYSIATTPRSNSILCIAPFYT